MNLYELLKELKTDQQQVTSKIYVHNGFEYCPEFHIYRMKDNILFKAKPISEPDEFAYQQMMKEFHEKK